MKIKAVYKSKANRPKISVCGETFFNNVPRIANLSYQGICIIKKAAEQGWFEIIEEYKKGAAPKVAAPAPVKEETKVAVETVADETPAEETVTEVTETVEEVTETETVVETEAVEEETDVALEDMKKDELIKLAEEHGIEVTSSMKKDEIIAAIKG